SGRPRSITPVVETPVPPPSFTYRHPSSPPSRTTWGVAAAALAGVAALAAGVLAFAMRGGGKPAPRPELGSSTPKPSASAAVSTPPQPVPASARCGEGMVLIPGATYGMGSKDGEGDEDEHPRHQVPVSPFCLD